MDELPAKMSNLREFLNVPWDESRVGPALGALHRQARWRRRRRRVAATAALVFLAALTVLIVRGQRHRWQAVSDRGHGQKIAASGDEAQVQTRPKVQAARSAGTTLPTDVGYVQKLSGGDHWRTLAPNSKVRLVSPPGRDVHVQLDQGAARFEFAARRDRRLRVSAGDVDVIVLGATFSVARETAGHASSRVHVAVERGHLEIHWKDRELLLSDGDARWFQELSKPPTSAAPAVRRRGGRHGARDRSAGGPDWRTLARQGLYEQATDQLGGEPSERSARVRDEPNDLFLAADSARLAQRPRQALPYLQRILARFATDRRAPLAAFTLGRIYLQLGEPLRAASAFAKTRRLEPDGPLAEDALAREAEAWHRAERADAARQSAERYLELYPLGRHAVSVRLWGGL
jgi:transmembrane sensor